MRNELRRLSSETVNGTSLAALRFPAQKGVYHCLTRESSETAKKNVAHKVQRSYIGNEGIQLTFPTRRRRFPAFS